MDIHTTDVVALVRGLLYEHGLTDWRFEWDRAIRRFGSCNYRKRVITLSRPLTERVPEAEVRDTILHEIAHALVGPGHGHGHAWQSKARSVGCAAQACKGVALDSEIEGKWQAICPGCGKTFHKHRQPKNVKRHCRACGSTRGQLSYRRAW